MTLVRTCETAEGLARLHIDRAVTAVSDAGLTLLLGHGAGGGVQSRDLIALAAGLPAYGVTVVRVEQPWRVAGRRVAGAPPSLDAAWLAVLAALRTIHRDIAPGPWVLGGRSAGARVACRTATSAAGDAGPVIGVLALAFPLRPRGRDVTRLPELVASGRPTLVVQGERDVFGGPEALAGVLPDTHVVHAVPGADHAFRVLRGHDQAATSMAIVGAVADWGESLLRSGG